jgi:hypothetical protein
MKDLFEYFRKRQDIGKPFLNSDGKKFFGEVHMIFNDGKVVHTRDWQMNDLSMVVESKKV